HVHVPAGAIPKDGPSAGIAMTTALASLLTHRPVKHNVGMTGEVTLQGRVLPIGGLKQKVLAAHAAGLTDVIIPERNRADLDDVANAYLARPDDQSRPGVLFIMDAFGLRPAIHEMVDRIAGWGYVVLAPNVFYRGGRDPVHTVEDPEKRGEYFASTIRPLMEQ